MSLYCVCSTCLLRLCVGFFFMQPWDERSAYDWWWPVSYVGLILGPLEWNPTLKFYSALEVWFIYLTQCFLSDWLSSRTAQLGWNGGFSCVSPSLHISLTLGTNGIMRNLHGGIVFRDMYHQLFPISIDAQLFPAWFLLVRREQDRAAGLRSKQEKE